MKFNVLNSHMWNLILNCITATRKFFGTWLPSGIIKKNSYERRAYESVDETNLSEVMYRKTTKKDFVHIIPSPSNFNRDELRGSIRVLDRHTFLGRFIHAIEMFLTIGRIAGLLRVSSESFGVYLIHETRVGNNALCKICFLSLF